jgi:chloramphenicol 3-O phosphotransferase
VPCLLAELERRERERGDHTIGEPRDYLAVVHSFGRYDYEVDTSAANPLENAQTS